MQRTCFLPVVFGIVILLLPLPEMRNAGLVLALGVAWLFFVVAVVNRLGFKVPAAVLILVLLLQAQWGLAQFVVQHDLGMYLLGETHLDVKGHGVAKFAMGSDKLIRAYGPYPHANSYAGGLVLVFILLVVWVTRERTLFVQNNMVSLWVVTIMLMLGIIVSFSRAAYLSTCFILLFALFTSRGSAKKIVWGWLGVITVVVLLFTPFWAARMGDPEDVAVSERLTGVRWAMAMIAENSWWQGVGLGNYPEALRVYLNDKGEAFRPWQIDYVHSVPLLLAAELGLGLTLGLFFLVLVGWLIFYGEQRWWLLTMSPLVLFDHYIVTQAAPLVILVAVAVLLHRRASSVYGTLK